MPDQPADVVNFYDNEQFYIPPCCRPGGRCNPPETDAEDGE